MSAVTIAEPPELMAHYDAGRAYDELLQPGREPRQHYQGLYKHLLSLPPDELHRRQNAADLSFLNQGITFTVYGNTEGTERIFPYDLIPRIITRSEWSTIDRGLRQRLTALNLFLHDIYHEGKIVKDGVVPVDMVYSAKHYRREMRDLAVPRGIYVAVDGTDLVRVDNGEFLVLEDNLRVPSGVSYMLANRQVMKRVFPGQFRNYGVKPINQYGQVLLTTLQSLAPSHVDNPTIVLLTPGVFNSAYFEHTYLARHMGVPMVEGRDLLVHDNYVYMRTTAGLERVDVVYRRVDDDYLDRFSAIGPIGKTAMLSRVADNLYWMARYLERAQHTARLLDVTLDLVPDRSAGAVTRSWEKLFASLHLLIPEGLPLKGRPITQMLALDAESDPSIVHHVASARDNARQVRELISSEMWEQINRLYLDLQKASMDRVWAAPHEFFHAVKQGAHLFQGITDSTMDRGEGWHFIQLGQYIERAGNVAGLLSAHLAHEAAGEALPHASDLYLEWLGLLRSCTAFEAYCKVYSADLRFEEIAEFLLLNDSFPFSINFAASMLRAALEDIADTTDTRRHNPILRRIGRLKATLDYEQIDELLAADLGSTLLTIQSQCAQIHTDIFHAYIAYPVEEKLTTMSY